MAKSSGLLRLTVTRRAEQLIRNHPWLFESSVQTQNRDGEAGELAVIYDRKDRFLAIGLYDPESMIAVRILHVGKPTSVDREWWRRNLLESLALRDECIDEAKTNGNRLINGESDNWPGLVMDRFDRVAVVKIYSLVWCRHLSMIVDLLREECDWLEGVVLRMSRNIMARAKEQFGLMDGQILQGPPIVGAIEFLENGLVFEADVLHGQKTGFFLDQRDNRQRVRELSHGKRVLNTFSYTGGFSIYAAAGGAVEVTDVDISQHAIESAERNWQLNLANENLSQCKHEAIKANAFDWLAEAAQGRRRYDMVIIDPPSLAKSFGEKPSALKAYRHLFSHGIKCVADGGTLVAASCTARVTADEFDELLDEVLAASNREYEILGRYAHAADHPATFPEAHYLKTACVRIS